VSFRPASDVVTSMSGVDCCAFAWRWEGRSGRSRCDAPLRSNPMVIRRLCDASTTQPTPTPRHSEAEGGATSAVVRPVAQRRRGFWARIGASSAFRASVVTEKPRRRRAPRYALTRRGVQPPPVHLYSIGDCYLHLKKRVRLHQQRITPARFLWDCPRRGRGNLREILPLRRKTKDRNVGNVLFCRPNVAAHRFAQTAASLLTHEISL
jgi:hypothetical protein